AQSFWNLVAEGRSFQELSINDSMLPSTAPRTELAMTEMIVGSVTGFLLGHGTPEGVVAGITNACEAYGIAVPTYLTVNYLLRVAERFRQLKGHWLGTPFGQTMELTWPATTL